MALRVAPEEMQNERHNRRHGADEKQRRQKRH
jgi:hypothetical protein